MCVVNTPRCFAWLYFWNIRRNSIVCRVKGKPYCFQCLF